MKHIRYILILNDDFELIVYEALTMIQKYYSIYSSLALFFINNTIRYKSRIYTDWFSVHVNCRNTIFESKLMHFGYVHRFVDHKIEFVCALFPNIYTNTVERLWRTIKDFIKYHNPKKLYLLSIGRFCFNNLFDKSQQLLYLATYSYKNELSLMDI